MNQRWATSICCCSLYGPKELEVFLLCCEFNAQRKRISDLLFWGAKFTSGDCHIHWLLRLSFTPLETKLMSRESKWVIIYLVLFKRLAWDPESICSWSERISSMVRPFNCVDNTLVPNKTCDEFYEQASEDQRNGARQCKNSWDISWQWNGTMHGYRIPPHHQMHRAWSKTNWNVSCTLDIFHTLHASNMIQHNYLLFATIIIFEREW